MEIKQRKYTRYNVPLSVEVQKVEDGATSYTGTTLNFSRSGLCLKTDETAPELIGALRIKVRMPENDSVVSAVGDIVWSRRGPGHSLIGIKLVAMGKDAKMELLDYCSKF